jgi:hypothetical protein
VIQAVGPGDRLLSISHATWDIDAVLACMPRTA